MIALSKLSRVGSSALLLVLVSACGGGGGASGVGSGNLVAPPVNDPVPAGGSSGSVDLVPQPAVPDVTSLSTTSVKAGSSSFELKLNGANFTPDATIQWNGTSLPTSFVSPTELTARVPDAYIALPGSANVAVVNDSKSSIISTPKTFAIEGPISPNVYFVAKNGRDTNPGTFSRPYLTIQKCASTVASGSTCAIRAGSYHETVKPNSGIDITSYNGETVTIDGSDPVTGWTLYQGSIYKASVALDAGDGNQIFVGNQMMTEARWPNGDDLFHVNWATAQAGTTGSQIVDSNLPDIDWTGARIRLWSGSNPFGQESGTVTASKNGQLSIDLQTGTCPYICPQTGGYYYLSGVPGALDAENEWYFDPSTKTLYLWAPGGVDPQSLDVRAKQRKFAFDLSGKSNVSIRNVGIFAAGVITNSASTGNVLDGIDGRYLSHATTLPASPGDSTGSKFSILFGNTGDSGIVFIGNGNTLRNSTLAYSAGNGVTLYGNNNAAINNLIHHMDYLGNYASGVTIYGDGSKVQNNTIHSMGRSAILVRTQTTPAGVDIGYNNIFDAMIFSRDGGAIYSCCNLATAAHVHHNWIHDTQSLLAGAASKSAATGVYVDNGTSGFTIDQNILWNNQFANILINGNGLATPNNNNVSNNSVPDINDTSWIKLTGILNCGTTQVVDNQVFVPLNNVGNDVACKVSRNGANAPGATEMNSSVQVGCNFEGCASDGPPTISGNSISASIAVQPLGVSVASGKTATFTVRAAGSKTLRYQWRRDGVDIAGANGASYTTAATSAADQGAVFTVVVGNSVGSVTSRPAMLSVK